MPVYNVPLVSSNLRPREMIIQMADTLDYLNEVTNDICSRINEKINHDRARIQNINQRVEIAQAKIDKNVGSRKAIKLFSSSRFPVSYQEETLSNDHNSDHCSQLSFRRTKLENINSETLVINDSMFCPSSTTNATSKPVPITFNSVSDLLIFNTEILVSQEQTSLDKSHKMIIQQKNYHSGRSENLLGAAPWSIGHHELQEKTPSLNFSYIPGIGQVPELDLPLALPDLPGIADDLAYNEDSGPGIAPSLIAALPDVSLLTSDISPMSIPPQPPVIPSSAPSTSSPIPPSDSHVSSLPLNNLLPSAPIPQPPPPPPPPAPACAPPPPPPPPPTLHLEESSSNQKASAQSSISATKNPATVSNGDLRSDLMSAIRAAGGKSKLNSSRVKHARALKEQSKKPSESTKSGDLMADLFNKLSMRRKGISGLKEEPANTMSRVSDMIPPPPSNVSSSDEVEDWK